MNRSGKILLAGLGVCVAAGASLAAPSMSAWWQPGTGRQFPASSDYPNSGGSLRVLSASGGLDTHNHPFFMPLGSNGRACVTCHQPEAAMSLSVAAADTQWAENGDKDSLFAAIDGANCPDLPQADRASHSLLLDHGLIRITRPWPPRDNAGHTIAPDFDLAVVRDPTGCNLSPKFGLTSAQPTVSVYRRPRMVANLKYVLAMGFNYDPKGGLPLPLDPETGKPASRNLMADARVLSLGAQMRDAGTAHLQFLDKMSADDLRKLMAFELDVFAAQQTDRFGGAVDAAGAQGGPLVLQQQPPGRLGSQGVPVWSEFSTWANAQPGAGVSDAEAAFRRSVARGATIFRKRTFLISDSSGINAPIGFGNPVRNSCVFCHNMSRIGMDVAPGQVDLGTTNMPFADPQPDLPLFRITCRGTPHPFYGSVIYSHDPGYALTTGRCADVGKITLQSLRGLSARAPYFSNGSAKDLRGVIDFYDRRYNIGYSEQDKQDLVNLMSVL